MARRQTLDWRRRLEGRFRWDGAPGDRVWLYVGKTGYRNDESPISPSSQETVITLVPGGTLRIDGAVVDAETGKPIPSFRVVPAVMAGPAIWFLDQAGTFRQGHYQVVLVLANQQHRIRIEAKGYLPVVSPVFEWGSGEHEFNARLVKGPWLDGTVRGANGRPLKGAEVALVTGQGVLIGGARRTARAPSSRVDRRRGAFSFSRPLAITGSLPCTNRATPRPAASNSSRGTS